MWGRPRAWVVASVVVVAALVPVFGDPRVTPVTHPLWARMLLRALEIHEAVRVNTRASQVFATLTWRDSLSLPAGDYVRADGISLRKDAGQVVGTTSLPAEVTYALAIVQPGEYRLRARLSGPPESLVVAEVKPFAGGASLWVASFAPAEQMQWVFGGTAHLDPGAYETQFLLPAGCALSRIEVAPPCVQPIEPVGGWKATGITTADDLAVTALRALDAEYELPPAASPLEMTGGAFQIEAPPEAIAQRAAAGAFTRSTLVAGNRGLLAATTFAVQEAGLYAISAFVRPGPGQRWVIDGCRKAVVCASPQEGWRPILTQSLAPGRHLLTLALGAEASVLHVRIERKKHGQEDYVAALRRLGFDAGPAGAITRGKALDAADFIRAKRRLLLAAMCGDPVRVEDSEPALVSEEDRERADDVVAPPPEPHPPTLPPVIETPLLPPQVPATPTLPLGS